MKSNLPVIVKLGRFRFAHGCSVQELEQDRSAQEHAGQLVRWGFADHWLIVAGVPSDLLCAVKDVAGREQAALLNLEGRALAARKPLAGC